MGNSFSIDVDGTAMREALEGESLKAVIKTFVKDASKVSADNIAREAIARLQRQLSGTSTNVPHTVDLIVVKSDRTGWGWTVVAGNPRMPMLDVWLEHGTVKMSARPFFWASATIEEQAHIRRVSAAIQAALSQYGLAGGQG